MPHTSGRRVVYGHGEFPPSFKHVCLSSRCSSFGSLQKAPGSVRCHFVPTSSPAHNATVVSKGREGKAAQILAKYHANGGDERDPLVVFELAQIRHAIRMEEEIRDSTSYWYLFATPGNRKRMRIIIAIAIFSQWRFVVLFFRQMNRNLSD